MIFTLFISVVIIQRLFEVIIARRNEIWMKQQGALEYGQNHYKYMVLMHISFFVVLIVEVVALERELSIWWPLYITIFLLLQIVRIWVISVLGKYWNTKIIVLPGIEVVHNGPFKWLKHPNYLIVTLELLVIPLLFQAYICAVIFFLLNQLMLAIRIPVEERALKQHTNYS
ncbi:isoprenylcysteine carboxyl methyltransferase family protein [Lederbergia graminis]|uniref:Isoprenylcysteine carboxyl methyltransferase family protein n=1 Tax=Lederbergia graminis TaxID=735518 RepID=A0ABW0LD97_9BACI|nr:isoprenylcysteine carboxylmethyltransferase family protein [Paenibacillus bovis]HLU23436.1 isoprenylcysteine carboxylmethyltransferase family protein [Bacillaceae bacterium]